jgi:methyltransferase family protein
MKLYAKLGDSERPESFANKLRRNRFVLFESLLEEIPRPVKILDAGGTQTFWSFMGMTEEKDVHVVLLNHTEEQVVHQNFKSVVGDVRKMQQFKDKEFDISFSNSVIEHVGDFSDQLRMANEMRRVGKRYFLQTPSRYFPIEPHFFFPFFQFLPLPVKLWLITHFALGSYPRITDRQKAIETVNSIRLLTKKELKILFPSAVFFEEKVFGFIKSFTVYEGW